MTSYIYNTVVDSYIRNASNTQSNISQMIDLMNRVNDNLDRLVSNEINFDLRREFHNDNVRMNNNHNSLNNNIPNFPPNFVNQERTFISRPSPLGNVSPRVSNRNNRNNINRNNINSRTNVTHRIYRNNINNIGNRGPNRRGIITPLERSIFNNGQINLGSLSPVAIRPSQQQISIATETIRYRDIVETTTQTRCPISLRVFTPRDVVIRIIHCGHIFDQHNILRWFRNNVRCPLCRYDIRNYSPMNIINNPYRRRSRSGSESELELGSDTGRTDETSNNSSDQVNNDNNDDDESGNNRENNSNEENTNQDENANPEETNEEINNEDIEESNPQQTVSVITADVSGNSIRMVNNFVDDIVNDVTAQVTEFLNNNYDQSNNTITAQMEFGFIRPTEDNVQNIHYESDEMNQ